MPILKKWRRLISIDFMFGLLNIYSVKIFSYNNTDSRRSPHHSYLGSYISSMLSIRSRKLPAAWAPLARTPSRLRAWAASENPTPPSSSGARDSPRVGSRLLEGAPLLAALQGSCVVYGIAKRGGGWSEK